VNVFFEKTDTYATNVDFSLNDKNCEWKILDLKIIVNKNELKISL